MQPQALAAPPALAHMLQPLADQELILKIIIQAAQEALAQAAIPI
jgi:hypothetical protein